MANVPSEILHFINGEFRPSRSGKVFNNLNPATGEQNSQVAEADAEDVDEAVGAARAAFRGWQELGQAERSSLLKLLGEEIERRFDDFLAAEVADTGKPISLAAHLDIPRGSANFLHFAEHFRYVPTECWQTPGVLNYATRKAVGVVGVIAPWNLPLLLTTWKVAPALAAGNCVVVKPSEETPTTASLLAEAAQKIGMPNGVLNVVHGFGPSSAGEALVQHPGVDAITFTGETHTGVEIMRNASSTLKKISFELGGKNPNLIFADADLELAVEGTLASSFSNQGEVCLCGSRIYVDSKIFDSFVSKLTSAIESKVVVGDPMNKNTTLGSLISLNHRERVSSYVELARADNAEILCGGNSSQHLSAGFKKGAFYDPTVMISLPEQSRAQQEEIFGPVVSVTPFESEEQAINLANGTRYGLSATIWTTNLSRAHRVSDQLDAGIVWVNTWFLRDLRTPFGGVKDSGIGREGGIYSLDFYTEIKNVCIKL